MKNFKIMLITLFSIFFSGCGATTYVKYNEGLVYGGYKDKKIKSEIYEVEFHGNGLSTLEDITNKMYKRAAELCGNNNFIVKNEDYDYWRNCGMNEGVYTCGNFPIVKGTVYCNQKGDQSKTRKQNFDCNAHLPYLKK